jgi:hypothetical protein
MNFLKTAFAILSSVLLVGAQPVFAAGQNSSPTSKECDCCSCKQMNCCMAQPNSTPQPIPTAPARAVSQNTFQIIAAANALLLQLPETASKQIAFASSASPKVTDVPLYEWNCSYLI